MSETQKLEEAVLELRRQGRPFRTVARSVGLLGGRQAVDAFVRALSRRPPEERNRIRQEELERLDALSRHLYARQNVSSRELARNLVVVQRLRDMVLAE